MMATVTEAELPYAASAAGFDLGSNGPQGPGAANALQDQDEQIAVGVQLLEPGMLSTSAPAEVRLAPRSRLSHEPTPRPLRVLLPQSHGPHHASLAGVDDDGASEV